MRKGFMLSMRIYSVSMCSSTRGMADQRVQILFKSTVFLLTLAVLEKFNHEIFSSCFSEDDSETEVF